MSPPVYLRPGRAADLPALVRLRRAEVRAYRKLGLALAFGAEVWEATFS